MPRPSVSPDRILEAAATLFAERGYTGTTTISIAERAGVNEVTLFRRFGNKQGILAALAKQWRADMAGFAVDLVGIPGDPRSTLEELARREYEGALSNGVTAMRLVMEATAVPEIAEVMGRNPHNNLQGLADYLADQQQAGAVRADLDPRVMAEAFFAMTSTQVIAHKMLNLGDHPSLSDHEIVRQLVNLFCDGIMPGRSPE